MTVNVSQDKTDEPLPQEKNVQVTQQVESTEKPNEDVKEDPNWRAFREARKQDRLKAEAAEKRAQEKEEEAKALRAAMEAAFAKGNSNDKHANTGYNQSQYEEEETEDQRIEKKVQKLLADREAAHERARQEREQQEYPQRLQQHFNDFQQTISNENLDYLDYHYPEVSAPLKRLNDGYEKWHDIYRAVKKFVPNNTTVKKEASKAEVNFNKPKSISSGGMTQTADSVPGTRLSEDRKDANWQRMQKLLKSVG